MMKALMLWGGWPGHEPKECVDIFAPFLEERGYDVKISDTLDVYLDESKMRAFSLMVPVWTQGTITREQETSLLKAVKSGVGIAGWHGGMGDARAHIGRYLEAFRHAQKLYSKNIGMYCARFRWRAP